MPDFCFFVVVVWLLWRPAEEEEEEEVGSAVLKARGSAEEIRAGREGMDLNKVNGWMSLRFVIRGGGRYGFILALRSTYNLSLWVYSSCVF